MTDTRFVICVPPDVDPGVLLTNITESSESDSSIGDVGDIGSYMAAASDVGMDRVAISSGADVVGADDLVGADLSTDGIGTKKADAQLGPGQACDGVGSAEVLLDDIGLDRTAGGTGPDPVTTGVGPDPAGTGQALTGTGQCLTGTGQGLTVDWAGPAEEADVAPAVFRSRYDGQTACSGTMMCSPTYTLFGCMASSIRCIASFLDIGFNVSSDVETRLPNALHTHHTQVDCNMDPWWAEAYEMKTEKLRS